jgi:hypothetical protein
LLVDIALVALPLEDRRAVTSARTVAVQARGSGALAVDTCVGVAVGVELAAAVEPPLLVAVGGAAMPLEYLASVVNLRTVGVQAGAGADVLQNGQVTNRADDLPPLIIV